MKITILLLSLLIFGCGEGKPEKWQLERDARVNLRVGMLMPAILKNELIEADGIIEKWRVDYSMFVTCKRDTVVSIWRKP